MADASKPHRNGHPLRHGLSYTVEYRTWQTMRDRCTNPKSQAWENYGGRGITICDRWLNDPQAFIDDMGPRPGGHEIDRIDNDAGYSKENCRWTTRSVNDRNRRSSKWIAYRGERRTLAEWCELLGLDRSPIAARFALGWAPERAFETPIRPKRHRLTEPQVCVVCGHISPPKPRRKTCSRACLLQRCASNTAHLDPHNRKQAADAVARRTATDRRVA